MAMGAMGEKKSWSESFSPRSVDQAVMMSGAGEWDDFLARGVYAAAGGFAAETIHDWVVTNKDDYTVLEGVAEETASLGMVVFAAYATERWVWHSPSAKIFTAGMAGRYGGAFWDTLKGFLGKKKAQGLGKAADEAETETDVSMDTSRKLARQVGEILTNSPKSLDKLADMMAATLAGSDEFKDTDTAVLRKKLRAGFAQTAEALAA